MPSDHSKPCAVASLETVRHHLYVRFPPARHSSLTRTLMNCVLYARVSTTEQAEKELSIPAQLQAMRDYAHQHSWDISEEFVEPGASAKTAARPILQRLLSRVREVADRKVDVVLVHKIDRLARNVYDHAAIKALLTANEVRLASVVENVDDSVSGQLVENIMASLAQFYSANLAEEVKKGMRQKVLKGGWPHKPPRGYMVVRDETTKEGRIEIHPTEGPLMRRAFELYATGVYSMRSLADRLAKDGLVARNGQPIAQANIQIFLRNSFYVGRVRWQELDVPGKHPVLVPRELFDNVQAMIRARYRNQGAKGTIIGFPLRGIAICASCRGRMTAERHKRWGYYRCSRQSYQKDLCPARFCNADRAHAGVENLCRRIHLPRGQAEAIQKAADRIIQQRVDAREQQLASLLTRRAALTAKEMKLTEAFMKGDMSSNAYKTATATLRQETAEVETQTSRTGADPDTVRAKVKDILRLATSLWDVYEDLNDERRAELLRSVFQAIVIGPDGVVGFTLKAPFDVLSARPFLGSATRVRDVAERILDAA
jgi:site-specific DNA recombinase